MRLRDAVLEYQKTLDDTGTYTKDIAVSDPVSAFWMEFIGTNGATSNKDNFLNDVISKIEIVNGSDVLFSLSLQEAQALEFYKTKRTPNIVASSWADGGQRERVYILFGRDLWDTEYGMDFTRFANPQLKITTNIAKIRAAGATGFLSGYLKASIVAKVMEEAPTRPAKFLQAKQIASWTSGTSGQKRVELPIDFPYRLAVVRGYVQQSDINEVFTNLKMTLDADTKVLFDRYVMELDAEALEQFGQCLLKQDIYAKHSTAVRIMVNKEPNCIWYPWEDATGYCTGIQYQWSSEFKPDLMSNAGAAVTTDIKATLHQMGHALHATLPVPFGILQRPETWFSPSGYRKCELVLTEAVAAAASVVLEQERPLP